MLPDVFSVMCNKLILHICARIYRKYSANNAKVTGNYNA